MNTMIAIKAFRSAVFGLVLSIAGTVQPALADLNCGLLNGATQVPFYDKPKGAVVGSVDVLASWSGKPVAGSGTGDSTVWFEVSDGSKVLGFMKANDGGVACAGDF